MQYISSKGPKKNFKLQENVWRFKTRQFLIFFLWLIFAFLDPESLEISNLRIHRPNTKEGPVF
jgi:hypothetical protein